MMATDDTIPFSRFLDAWKGEDSGALELLLPSVLAELRQMARQIAGTGGLTLSPSELFAEVSHTLFRKPPPIEFENRSHFFGYARGVMRNLYREYWRRKKQESRGGDLQFVPLHELKQDIADLTWTQVDHLDLYRVLDDLRVADSDLADIVEARYLMGFTIEETADLLDVTLHHVKTRSSASLLWLRRHLPVLEGG